MPGLLIKNVEYKGAIGDYFFRMQDQRGFLFDFGKWDHVIDGTGLILIPPLFDRHVHFRDPGFTEKEDLLSGARAAAAGGYSHVCCEPNTRPVIDTPEAVSAFSQHVRELQLPIMVRTKCALTLGQRGDELVDIRALGMKGFSEWSNHLSSDGEPVVDRELLIQAFRQAALNEDNNNSDIDLHCEETPNSSVHLRSVLGDGPAMAREPELIRLAISALAEAIRGADLHIQHVSMAASLPLISEAKRSGSGMCVTAEVTPHHLLFCEEDILLRNGEHDPNWKMNPPLRSRADMLAMRKALADGTIDYIATDHAPHTSAEKACGWDKAPFGVIGLETAFGACMSLVHAGELSFSRLVEAMSGSIYSIGGSGCATLIDPRHSWTVDPDKFYSKGRNCPFAGMTFTGKPVYTIAFSKLVMAEGEVLF